MGYVTGLDQDMHGNFTATYEWKTFRFLMEDGRTVDVRAVMDDSDLRTAVRDITKATKIVGVATVPEPVAEEPAPKKVPAKKVPAKKTSAA